MHRWGNAGRGRRLELTIRLRGVVAVVVIVAVVVDIVVAISGKKSNSCAVVTSSSASSTAFVNVLVAVVVVVFVAAAAAAAAGCVFVVRSTLTFIVAIVVASTVSLCYFEFRTQCTNLHVRAIYCLALFSLRSLRSRSVTVLFCISACGLLFQLSNCCCCHTCCCCWL